ILEDTQRDQLSGRSAPWSGAGVQAAADSLAATREVIATLRPLLEGRGEALAPIETDMLLFGRVLGDVRRAHGGALPALSALTHDERQRVNGTLGLLLQSLSLVPDELVTQLPPKLPTIAEQEKMR